MDWKEFERVFCEILKAKRYWALNIPKNESGAQPFDIIAVRAEGSDQRIVAVDCKVCSRGTFSLDRVEWNQWLAFETFDRDAIGEYNYNTVLGIVCLYDKKIYYVPYYDLKFARDNGIKSINLKERRKGNPFPLIICDEKESMFLIGRGLS